MKTRTFWIAFTGMIWLVTGMSLLTFGLHLIVQLSQLFPFETHSLIARLTSFAGGREKAALALIIIGLILGFIKGRYVFTNTIRRIVERILQLPLPIKISQIYNKKYLFLIGGMILLGMSLRMLKVPQEIRGIIDVAVGSALINGAFAYFQIALKVYRQKGEG